MYHMPAVRQALIKVVAECRVGDVWTAIGVDLKHKAATIQQRADWLSSMLLEVEDV